MQLPRASPNRNNLRNFGGCFLYKANPTLSVWSVKSFRYAYNDKKALLAKDFFWMFLRNSNFLVGNSIIGVNPFKFREDAYQKPSEFSITFTVKEVKYVYSFSCTRQKVINEKLDAYYSAKPTSIFERTDTNNYVFKNDVKKLNDIRSKNSENKLFLVTSATWEYEKTKPVVDYLLNNIKFNLNLEEESLGTVQMFMMSPLLYYVFKDGRTLFVDEIDKSLHPILVEHIVKLFLDKSINSNDAQLIANTHDTNLLNLDIFRRDDIWFTERDVNSGKSEMYSLADFSPRKDENIEKAYLLGRYGAIPFIKE